MFMFENCLILYIFRVIIECQIGYFWINCERKCFFPYFGEKCKETCQCPKLSCDFATGCNTGKYIFNCSHKWGFILLKCSIKMLLLLNVHKIPINKDTFCQFCSAIQLKHIYYFFTEVQIIMKTCSFREQKYHDFCKYQLFINVFQTVIVVCEQYCRFELLFDLYF